MKKLILPLITLILAISCTNKGESRYPNQRWCICDTLGNVIDSNPRRR